jgi:hypothetical protein
VVNAAHPPGALHQLKMQRLPIGIAPCEPFGVTLQDDDLIRQLDRTRGWRRVVLAADLGYSDGKSGPVRLRQLLSETGPGTSDLRCAALLALAKRCKADAHEDFAAAFHSADAGTRGYAILAMAAYGREGLWDEVSDRLVKTLERRERDDGTPSKTALMITYLARHAVRQPVRVQALVNLLRKHWASLDPVSSDGDKVMDLQGGSNTEWVQTYWPDAVPGGPPADEVAPPLIAAMQEWIRSDPLLAEKSIPD